MPTAQIVRMLLIIIAAGMAVLALYYLSQRKLRWWAYLGWGLLAILVPMLGPFLVIALRPGEWKKA
jgi:hypothetical protein